MAASENRQTCMRATPYLSVSRIGAMTMSLPSLYVERINTPTGRMMIVTDGEQRLRALDWEDHEPRMQRLLRRHYGEIHLREEARPTAVADVRHGPVAWYLLPLQQLPHAA